MLKKLPSFERLQHWLRYDPETGHLLWLITDRYHKEGDVAGARHRKGYWTVAVDGQRYLAHRIVWLLCRGVDPYPHQIDHRDRIRDNNRIDNLRLADDSTNAINKALRSHNKSGVTGVFWSPHRKRWVATIGVDRVQRSLGTFRKYEDAVEARQTAVRELHGEFAPDVSSTSNVVRHRCSRSHRS